MSWIYTDVAAFLQHLLAHLGGDHIALRSHCPGVSGDFFHGVIAGAGGAAAGTTVGATTICRQISRHRGENF